MKIFQHATLSANPTEDFDAATKQYVDQAIQGGVGGAVTGGVFITNIAPTSTGIVGNKLYVANTVPANKVLTDATTDTDSVRVTIFAEGGGSFYSPIVTITTVPAQAGGPIVATLTEDANDKRAYNGYADLVGITADTVVTATSSTNAVDDAIIHRAAAGPVTNFVTIGSLPGSQTEAKSGDVVTITGRVSNDANYAEIIAGGAAGALAVLTVGAADSFGTGFRSISGSFTVSGLSGSQSISARARNSLGTFGSALASTNSITLNQTYPTIGARTITYPSTQSGLKNTETATVAATVTNGDTVVYTSPGSELTITSPSTYASSKTVTRAGGTYNFGTNNYTITATKTSNAAVTVASSSVTIANTAPSAAITITGSPARLQSSAAGQDYTITVTATQRLNVAPSITPSSGTFQGSWVGGPQVWTRTLRIVDTDPKGSQTFTASLTNLANVVGTTITAGSTYTVGGFPTRTITFAAFERYHAIGTTVGDITKVTASYTGAASLTRQTSTADVFQGFTIVDASGNYNANGGYLYISDAAFAGSNTTGTLQLDVTEAA